MLSPREQWLQQQQQQRSQDRELRRRRSADLLHGYLARLVVKFGLSDDELAELLDVELDWFRPEAVYQLADE